MQTYSGYFLITGIREKTPVVRFEREAALLMIDINPDMDMELYLYEPVKEHRRFPDIKEIPGGGFEKTVRYEPPKRIFVMMVELSVDERPIYGKPMIRPGNAVSRLIHFDETAWLEKGADRIYVGCRSPRQIAFLFRLVEGIKRHGVRSSFE